MNVRKLRKKTYDKYIEISNIYDLYENNKFGFNKGLTVLIGKNGSGKTTLLYGIKENLDNNKIPCILYINEYHEQTAKQSFLYDGNMKDLVQSINKSEGQNITFNFSNNVGEIGKMVKNCIKNKEKEMFILLDGLDSGLSIDGINELLVLFDFIMKQDGKCLDIYIIISANSYEFVRNQDCIYVSNAEHKRFCKYEDYRDFIVSDMKKESD